MSSAKAKWYYFVLNGVVMALFYRVISGGFRHVQHVRPNRGPHKKGVPT